MFYVVPDSNICAKCHAGPIRDSDWPAHLRECQGVNIPDAPTATHTHCGSQCTMTKNYQVPIESRPFQPKPRVVSVWHRWWSHRWSSWSEPESKEFTRLPSLGAESVVTGGQPIEYVEIIQKRRCLICDAEQRRIAW